MVRRRSPRPLYRRPVFWYNRRVENGELEEAFLKFRTRLERLAARALNPVLSRRLSPEDVVQETMVSVSRDSGSFMSNPDIPLYFRLRAALLQTVARLERVHLAAGKRDAYREVDRILPDADASQCDSGFDFPDTATSPLSRIDRQDRHETLHEAMMRLEDNDRAILELRHEEGLGNGECAALLGISEKAASLRHVRALKRLKDILAEYSEFAQ